MPNATQQPASATHRSQKIISPLLCVGLLLGVALHLAGFLIFRVISSPLPDRVEARPYVEYVSEGSLASDRELEEQAELFDSAPLFIPTHWNASQVTFVESGDVLREQFPEFEPKIELQRELQPSRFLVVDSAQIDDPLDLLASRFWRFFSGFAESAVPIVAFEDQPPVAEVSVVGQSSLQPISIPAVLDYTTASPVARPVLYYIRMSGSGAALSSPTLGQSSGNVAFDLAAVKWLRTPEVQGLLPKGYLAVKVFPW